MNRVHPGFRRSSIQDFKSFSARDKEKIAASLEQKSSEMIISRVVEDYVYATTRALDAGDYFSQYDRRGLWEHAVNKNSDYFDITELEDIHPEKNVPRYLTFRTAGMYKNHESDKIENSIGLVFDSVIFKEPYEDMHVTALFGVDKKKAPWIAQDLEKYPTRVPVSMGCTITHAVCTACGKEIYHGLELCDCLKYHRGRRRNGKKVAELLRGVDFFELSVVSSPAAPKAYVIDAITSIIPGRFLKVAHEAKEFSTVELLNTIYTMIHQAKTIEEKHRLNAAFDQVIDKLERSLNTRV